MLKFLIRFKFLLFILAIMTSVLTVGSYLPVETKRMAYTLSNFIRTGLMFLLPFLVLPFIVSSISLMKSKGIILVFSLIFLITLSNFVSICIGGVLSSTFVPMMSLETTFNPGDAQTLEALYEFELEPLLSIETILMIGFVLGIALSFSKNNVINGYVETTKKFSTFFFQKIFIPLMPVYIFGTLLKLDVENDFAQVFRDFGSVILMIVLVQLSYITFMFWVGNKFSFSKAIACLKNCLPAWLLGFSTMSSLVTMPVTLKAAEENLEDKNIAQVAITSTVNCHDVGECISLTVIAMTVLLMSSGMVFPEFSLFIKFAFILAVAQFTGVSVPGGSVVIIIPLLTRYFNFSPEMIGLVATLSIFMDPIGTAHNVLGNSAFALIIKRYFRMIQKFSKKDPDLSEPTRVKLQNVQP